MINSYQSEGGLNRTGYWYENLKLPEIMYLNKKNLPPSAENMGAKNNLDYKRYGNLEDISGLCSLLCEVRACHVTPLAINLGYGIVISGQTALCS